MGLAPREPFSARSLRWRRIDAARGGRPQERRSWYWPLKDTEVFKNHPKDKSAGQPEDTPGSPAKRVPVSSEVGTMVYNLRVAIRARVEAKVNFATPLTAVNPGYRLPVIYSCGSISEWSLPGFAPS
jgi:hypothetical protein